MIFSGMLECDYFDLKWRFEMYQTTQSRGSQSCPVPFTPSGQEGVFFSEIIYSLTKLKYAIKIPTIGNTSSGPRVRSEDPVS